MTVTELIEKLKEMPQDAIVILPYHEEAESILVDEERKEVEIRP